MKNKKIILAVVGLLVAAFLILPKVFGGQIEKETVSYFDELYKTTSNQEIEIEFDKGWFSSTATISFDAPKNFLKTILKTPEDAEKYGEKQNIIIHVSHGPFIFSKFRFGLASFRTKGSFFLAPPVELKSPYNQIPQYTFTGVLNFDGSANNEMFLPAFEISLEEAMALTNPELEAQTGIIKFDEVLLKTKTVINDKNLFLKIEPASFRVSGTDGKGSDYEFLFENLSFDGSYLLNIPYPINYDRGTLSMDRIQFKMDGKSFFMENLKSADFISRGETTPLLDYQTEFQFGAIGYYSEENETNSPQVTATNGSIEILNINGDAIVDLMELLVDFPEEPTEEENVGMKKAVEAIFSPGLEYNYPMINVQTQWGNVHYTHRMIFPALDLADQFNAQIFASEIYYLANFKFDESFVNFMVDQVLKNQMGANLENLDDETQKNLRAATLGQLLLAKYLVKNEDGTFTAKFAFENGIFTLNGNPIDLMQALGQTS